MSRKLSDTHKYFDRYKHFLCFLGTDADEVSRISKEAENYQDIGTKPTVNKIYQMLYSSPDLHNQTKLLNVNSSLYLTHNFNFYDSLNSSDGTLCCLGEGSVNRNNVSLSDEGANVVVLEEKTVKQKKNRRRRVVNVIRTGDVTASDLKEIGTTTVSIPSVPSLTIERRRKPGETGSSAPLLNYIFDTYSNIHQHRNEK